jgi:hypothetical protein
VVSHDKGPDTTVVYDRQLLLFGAKREQVPDLWEVQRYGADSFGDPTMSRCSACVLPTGVPGASGCWDELRSSAQARGGQNRGVLLGTRGWHP